MPIPSPSALFPKITYPQKRALLAAYVTCGRISHAAQAAKVDLRLHYYWKKVDIDYLEAWHEAQQMVGDFLEEEAVRRAREGVTKAIFYKDEHIADEVVYSDILLIFLLKGAMPEKYRERYEHTGAKGGPLEIKVVYEDAAHEKR